MRYKKWITKKLKLPYCELCDHFEKTTITQLTLHHRNLDRKDNNKKNLITLCQNCHTLIHQLINILDKTGRKKIEIIKYPMEKIEK